jgi:hypothetical protein
MTTNMGGTKPFMLGFWRSEWVVIREFRLKVGDD